MKRLKLKRVSVSPYVTLGVIMDANTGIPIVLSLELPDKGNRQRISCIPEGTYVVKPYNSDKFPKCYHVQDVVGRDKILFHPANTVDDILGCIGVGMQFGELNKKPAVLQSKLAMDILRRYIGVRSSFELEIVKA